jgi:hypothetical protein
MGQFLDACRNAIAGVLRGFDRIVFHGRFRRLSFAEGAQQFFTERGVLFKDAKDWIQEQTHLITADVERISQSQVGRGIIPISSSRSRKEELVRKHAQDQQITEGLIGAWSCVEECASYQIRPAEGRPVLVPIRTRCKHLYLYLNDPTYGFMSIRLQTWLPFQIQIALNGREWLSRNLIRSGVDHELRKNKIVACSDFSQAQRMLDHQVQRSDWPRLLQKFVPTIFPSLEKVVGQNMAYTWTCWQSEWATDLIYNHTWEMRENMAGVLEHALATGNAARIMRYFDRETNADEMLRQNANPEIVSRMLSFADGMRLRHWLGGNSVKIYNQFNVVRIETTVNNPGQFKTIRPSGSEGELRAMPMRKGVVDMNMRAKISDAVNERVLDSLPQSTGERVQDILARVTAVRTVDGRHVRGLRPFDKDLPLIKIIGQAEWTLTGFSNAQIRKGLQEHQHFRHKTDKQLAGYVTRMIRLLRDHGLIRKLPLQHRYQLNSHGRSFVNAIHAVLSAEVKALMETAA